MPPVKVVFWCPRCEVYIETWRSRHCLDVNTFCTDCGKHVGQRAMEEET